MNLRVRLHERLNNCYANYKDDGDYDLNDEMDGEKDRLDLLNL